MKKPTQCVLWEKPELVYGTMKERFELIATYISESHLWRYLLKCRECGQLYFFQFYEEIDWDDGDDPQYSMYIPVETDEEVEVLSKTSPLELLEYTPRLTSAHPKGAKERQLYWVGK
jgi:hypothetical protein